jgi:hypothetical protein
MSLHGLLSVTIGVPNVHETAAYYDGFGLTPGEGARGLFAWGPPPPPSFLHPEDLAAMMTGARSARYSVR